MPNARTRKAARVSASQVVYHVDQATVAGSEAAMGLVGPNHAVDSYSFETCLVHL